VFGKAYIEVSDPSASVYEMMYTRITTYWFLTLFSAASPSTSRRER
jgi:hypothetical protein